MPPSSEFFAQTDDDVLIVYRDCCRTEMFGLACVNFQVMRRTHASLMRELKVDPKIVADQLGHSVDVDLNVYTKTALGHLV